VQNLQHPAGGGPPTATKEGEIRSLQTEIDILKKQIAGQDFCLHSVELSRTM